MALRVYSGTRASFNIATQGGVPAGSHVDVFIPFNSFISETDGGVDFASVGAIVWNVFGVDSLDFEISDYETDNALEWGDLPENLPGGPVYPTTLANNGPRHTTSTFLRLGQNLDIEQDGQPSTDALGDDKDNNAPYPTGDEDGVEPQRPAALEHNRWWSISYTVSLVRGPAICMAGSTGTITTSSLGTRWFQRP